MSNVRIQLSTGYLDVEPNTAFPINFGIADVRDISKRAGAFSKTITLSGSKNNHNLLNHYYDVNIQEGTFNIDTITECIVTQNGLPILENGVIQLLSVNKSQASDGHEEYITYSVLVKDTQADFFTKLDNKELTDIDFSDFNHVISASNIVATFTNTEADGYKYFLPATGDNVYPLKEMRPAIFAKTYFDRIFKGSGFEYSWSTLTDAHFDKLLIPFNGDIVNNDYTNYIVEASNSAITINGYQSAGTNVSFNEGLLSWTEDLDLNSIFTPLTGSYAVPFVMTGGDSATWTVTVEADLNLLNATGATAYLVDVQTQIQGKYYRYQPVFVLYKNGSPLNGGVANMTTYVQKTEGYSVPNGSTNIKAFTNTFSFPTTNLLATDVLTIRAGVVITSNMNTAQLPRWRSAASGGTDILVDVELDITDISFSVAVNSSLLPSGAILNINQYVPNKIKQKDFIKSIFQMYNLFTDIDPSTPNTLILKHRDDYYDDGLEMDWTDKLAKDVPQSLQFLPELSAKKMILTYKQDTDTPNVTYYDATREIYGQVEYTFDNEYVRGVDTKELIFSPTPIYETVFGAYVPYINGMTPKSNIRILHDGGSRTCLPYNIYDYAAIGQTNLTSYPLVHHFDDALNPTFDINFATCDYYYYDGYQPTNNNLYNLYWRRTINQMNSGKMLTASFYLDENDIQSLKLNAKIRIDNSWWNINKVIDYNANDRQLTVVELMSIDTEIDLAPFKVRPTGRPIKPTKGQYAHIIKPFIRDKYINNNTVGQGADVEIKGYNNVVYPGVKGSIDGDDKILSEDGTILKSLTVTDEINGIQVDDLGSNFANTDLTFDGDRFHSTDGNELNITTDNGAYLESFIYLTPSVAEIGNLLTYVDFTPTKALFYGNNVYGFAIDGSGVFFPRSITTKITDATTTYNVTSADYVVNCTSGTFTVNLPTAVSIDGRTYIIKNSGTGVITIDGDGTETIDGALTYLLSLQYDSVTLVSNGANWIII